MSEADPDRTLAATARKLLKARAQGQVARSRDLGHFAALGVGLALLAAVMPLLTAWCTQLLRQGLRFGLADTTTPASMLERLGALGGPMLLMVLACGGVVALLAVAASSLVGGWNFTWQPLAPKFSKLNPFSGLQRMLSLQHLGDTAKACLLAMLLGILGVWWVRGHWPDGAQLLALPLPQALPAAGALLQDLLLAMGLLLALFALVDVPLQRHLLARRLRMSVQEMKREMRESEGNAEVKGKRRALMRHMSGRRTLAAVHLADLVVMNPSHYAVALKYDDSKMAAPRVVAKGADLLAQRMRQAALDAKVPVLQHPPLARALFAHTEVDREIPARLFSAVAQVLAWVYQLRDAAAQGRRNTTPAPLPEVPADMDPLNKANDDLNGNGVTATAAHAAHAANAAATADTATTAAAAARTTTAATGSQATTASTASAGARSTGAAP
jgi:flagellar biosynthesis protein FlhB